MAIARDTERVGPSLLRPGRPESTALQQGPLTWLRCSPPEWGGAGERLAPGASQRGDCLGSATAYGIPPLPQPHPWRLWCPVIQKLCSMSHVASAYHTLLASIHHAPQAVAPGSLLSPPAPSPPHTPPIPESPPGPGRLGKKQTPAAVVVQSECGL